MLQPKKQNLENSRKEDSEVLQHLVLKLVSVNLDSKQPREEGLLLDKSKQPEER